MFNKIIGIFCEIPPLPTRGVFAQDGQLAKFFLYNKMIFLVYCIEPGVHISQYKIHPVPR